MKIKNSVKIAFRNLNRRKMRTFLTAFAVSIGAMLIILMVSLGVGVQNIIENTLKADAAANVVNVSKYYSGDLANTENKDEVKNKVLDKDALEKIKSINEVDDKGYFYFSI